MRKPKWGYKHFYMSHNGKRKEVLCKCTKCGLIRERKYIYQGKFENNKIITTYFKYGNEFTESQPCL